VEWNLPERLRGEDRGADLASELRTKADHLREDAPEQGPEQAQSYDHAGMLDEAAEIVEWAGDEVDGIAVAPAIRKQERQRAKDSLEEANRRAANWKRRAESADRARDLGRKQERERVLEALRQLESCSIHMENPAYVKTPVVAFIDFRLALDSLEDSEPTSGEVG
jgi:translation initiation factor IF-2